MSNSRRLAAGLALLGAGAAVAIVACESVPLTAAPGTMMFLQANPPFVVANGGTSVVTAVLTEPAGTLVPDGTVVLFLTTLGRIDAEGKTVNGFARVHFVADSRSGEATVTAWSGGEAPAPAPSTSPTPASATPFSASARVAASAAGDVATEATGTGEGSASITINIGSALPARVVVSANPQVLASSRQAAITANVFDGNGNPVQNVPVVFSVSSATTLQEFLSSGGSPQYTDSNGQAFDTLTTRAPNGPDQKVVTVTATAANGQEDTVDVAVNYTKGF
jgi:hypothetical protein